MEKGPQQTLNEARIGDYVRLCGTKIAKLVCCVDAEGESVAVEGERIGIFGLRFDEKVD